MERKHISVLLTDGDADHGEGAVGPVPNGVRDVPRYGERRILDDDGFLPVQEDGGCAVNNDEQEAAVSVSLPFSVKEAEFLLQSPGNPISRNPAAGEAEGTGVFCLQDRHLSLTLPPNGGIVLRLFPVS